MCFVDSRTAGKNLQHLRFVSEKCVVIRVDKTPNDESVGFSLELIYENRNVHKWTGRSVNGKRCGGNAMVVVSVRLNRDCNENFAWSCIQQPQYFSFR